MGKGRKNLPAEIKKLQGTERPSRVNQNAPEVEKLTKVPNAPRWFSDQAKKVWRDTTRQLMATNIISGIDLQLLIAYCNEYAKYLTLEAELEQDDNRIIIETTKNGKVSKVNPKVKIAEAALEKAMKIGSEFGMTPSARSKVSAVTQDARDPFEEFLNGK